MLWCWDDSSLSYRKNFYFVKRPNSNCKEAKEALLMCINYKELEDEAGDRELMIRSHSETIHNTNIIGTCCYHTRIHEKHYVDS